MTSLPERQCYKGSAHPAHTHVSNVYPHAGYHCPGITDQPLAYVDPLVEINQRQADGWAVGSPAWRDRERYGTPE
jgi:hypothetical protein